MDIERQLLFVVLAVQLDFIDQQQMADACAGWAARRDKTLSELLLERGWLTDEDRVEVERLLDRKLHRANGDARVGLREALQSTARDVLQGANDQAIAQSMAGLESEATPSTDATIDYVPAPRRFALESVHGEGGLGQVWLAHDKDLNRKVALKRIKPSRLENADARRRFVREAQVTGQLDHPNIVPVYELGHLPGTREPYYAMKLVQGRSLSVAIADFHALPPIDASRSLARGRLLGALVQVANAVAYAHARGVLHRDLKPPNVILGSFGEVILLDWGLAHLRSSNNENSDNQRPCVELAHDAVGPGTTAGKVLGSLAYMAPEQARGETEELDERTDVYGLGAILYEMLAGKAPHGSGTTEELIARIGAGPSPVLDDNVADAPAALRAICTRAMAHDPAERYQSVRDFVEQLESWRADEPIAAYRNMISAFAFLTSAHPENATYRDQLARSRATFGLVLDAMGRQAEAERQFLRAINDYQTLVDGQGYEPRHLADLASVRAHLARVLATLGREDDAKQQRAAALAAYETLATAQPHSQQIAADLADVYVTMIQFEAPGALPSATEPATAPTVRADQRAAPDISDAHIERGTPPGSSEFECETVWSEIAPPRERAESPPEPLAPRLTILHHIGSGGAGRILAALDNDLNRTIAVKQLPSHAMNDERLLAMFLREAQISAQLEHPNILPVYGLGHDRKTGAPYLMMRLVSAADTLRDAIQKCHAASRPKPRAAKDLRPLLSVLLKVCDAISYAHSRGVIHRDIKPTNVLMGAYGEVFVIDWGLAKLTDAPGGLQNPRRVTLAEAIGDPFEHATIMGTPAYLAPEAARGRNELVDHRSDIYGLGALLFQILTGSNPYRSERSSELLKLIATATSAPSARSIAPGTPRSLDAITARAMAPAPDDRYQSVRALANDIEAWMAGGPVSAYPGPILQRVFKKIAPRRS